MVYPLKRSWHIITILTLAVQAAVLDRFGDEGGFDGLGAGQVGDEKRVSASPDAPEPQILHGG